jgi:hypothetical protein
MSAFSLYCILMLDNVQALAGWMIGLSIVYAVVFIIAILIIAACMHDCSYNKFETKDLLDHIIVKSMIKFGKRLCFIPVLGFLIGTFVPNTKQAMLIRVVPSIINDKNVQDIGRDSLKLVHDKIEELLKENK